MGLRCWVGEQLKVTSWISFVVEYLKIRKHKMRTFRPMFASLLLKEGIEFFFKNLFRSWKCSVVLSQRMSSKVILL